MRVLLITLKVTAIYVFLIYFFLFADDIAIYFWGNNANQVSALATFAGAVIALIAVIGVFIELSRIERQGKRQRTFDLIAKHYDPGFIEFTLYARYKLMQEADYTYEQYWEDKENRIRFIAYFNYYEDLSHMYNRNLVDKTIFVESLRGAICLVFRKSHKIIEGIRNSPFGSPNTFKQWEILYEKLK